MYGADLLDPSSFVLQMALVASDARSGTVKVNHSATVATAKSRHLPGMHSFASFLSKISDVFHVLFDSLTNHVEGLFLRLGGYLR